MYFLNYKIIAKNKLKKVVKNITVMSLASKIIPLHKNNYIKKQKKIKKARYKKQYIYIIGIKIKKIKKIKFYF